MKRTFALAQIAAMCLCVAIAVGCGEEETPIAATPSATAPEATPGSPQPASPRPAGTPATAGPTDISSRGDEVETLANTVAQKVTWEDGATYEAPIPDLVFRTAGMPNAGRGHRVEAIWLEDGKWQVIISMRVTDHWVDPVISVDLRAEFYYDEEKAEFTAANGRALFALTGRDSCTSDQPEPDYCPLDKEVGP
ncbi:MAG: hypothetical protein MUP14_08005 [Dehalococcoidia bacterium]|nr:hypothetical protein [Dehalococcoidia bacterium]